MRRLVFFLPKARCNERKPKTDWPEHEDSNELHQCSNLDRRRPDRGRSCNDLRDGVDSQPCKGTISELRHFQQRSDQRENEDHHHSKHCREGDRGSNVRPIRPDHGSNGGNCGIAAYRVAARNQDREALGKAQKPADGEAEEDCAGDDPQNRDEKWPACCKDGRRADGRTEQYDGNFEQQFCTEIDAPSPRWTRRPERPDQGADEDRNDECLDPRPTRRSEFDVLENVGGNRDEGAERQPRDDLRCS
jgi:hypothetical protein